MGRRFSIAAAATFSLTCAAASPEQIEQILQAYPKRGLASVQHVHIPAVAAAGMAAFVEQPLPFMDASTEEGRCRQCSHAVL